MYILPRLELKAITVKKLTGEPSLVLVESRINFIIQSDKGIRKVLAGLLTDSIKEATLAEGLLYIPLEETASLTEQEAIKRTITERDDTYLYIIAVMGGIGVAVCGIRSYLRHIHVIAMYVIKKYQGGAGNYVLEAISEWVDDEPRLEYVTAEILDSKKILNLVARGDSIDLFEPIKVPNDNHVFLKKWLYYNHN